MPAMSRYWRQPVLRKQQFIAGRARPHKSIGRMRRAGLHWSTTQHEECNMPIRIASLTQRIAKNGAMFHLAMMDRIHSRGADHEPSETERALAEERRLLKEERAKRQLKAQQPRAKTDKLVKTHHPQSKERPKARKEPKEAKA